MTVCHVVHCQVPLNFNGEKVMEEQKLRRMIQEFPFLEDIFNKPEINSDEIDWITVKRADVSLLSIVPHAFQIVEEYEDICILFAVCAGGNIFELAWKRDDDDEVSSVGEQLSGLPYKVDFVVELRSERKNLTESSLSEVVVHKMRGFNW